MGKKPSKMTILFFLGNQRLKELREWESARKMCWKPGFLFPLSKKHLVTLFPSIPEGKTSIIPATPAITIPSFIGNTVHSGFQKFLFISLYLVFKFFYALLEKNLWRNQELKERESVTAYELKWWDLLKLSCRYLMCQQSPSVNYWQFLLCTILFPSIGSVNSVAGDKLHGSMLSSH